MIYSNNDNIRTESVALFGNDADELLEFLDIELGESTIAIGENVYNGAEAERFLNENGIMLYEDHIVLEGKQAEEYKARKAAEKQKKWDDNAHLYDKEEKRFDDTGYTHAAFKHADGKGLKYFDNEKDREETIKMLKSGGEGKMYQNHVGTSFPNKLANKEYKRRRDNGEFVTNHTFRLMADAEARRNRKKYGQKVRAESTIFDFDIK